jgi:cobalt-zinc-cadmium efflux system outer membrane protein
MALLAVLAPLAIAAPANPAPTLAALIDVALHDNKDLQAARHAVDGARARLQQAGLGPNPRLELAGRNDTLFSNDGEYAVSVGFSQEFPIAGRLARQQDVARVDVVLALAEIAQAERTLAGNIAAAYYRLLVLDRQVDAQDRLIGVDDALLSVTRNRLRAAEVAETDVTTAQLELRRASEQRALLQTQRATQRAELNQLLGRAGDAALTIDDTLPTPDALPDAAVLQRQALAARPDLRTAYLNADRARAEQALARAERWEDWTVGVGVEQDRLVLDGAPPQQASRAIGVSLSIPLPLRNNRQGRIAEALAAGAQAHANVQALSFSIANEIARRYAEVTRLAQSLADYQRELLPGAAHNVALVQQAYRQGLAPIFTVIQSQRQQAEVTQANLDVLDRYLQGLAALHTAAATYTQHLALPEVSTPAPDPEGK